MSYIDLDEEFRQSSDYTTAKKEYAQHCGHKQCGSCERWYDSHQDFTDRNGEEHDTCYMCCSEWQTQETNASECNRIGGQQ